MSAIIRGTFHINPDKLSDTELCKLYTEAIFYLKYTGILEMSTNTN